MYTIGVTTTNSGGLHPERYPRAGPDSRTRIESCATRTSPVQDGEIPNGVDSNSWDQGLHGHVRSTRWIGTGKYISEWEITTTVGEITGSTGNFIRQTPRLSKSNHVQTIKRLKNRKIRRN